MPHWGCIVLVAYRYWHKSAEHVELLVAHSRNVSVRAPVGLENRWSLSAWTLERNAETDPALLSDSLR